jgi:hypothetical protein
MGEPEQRKIASQGGKAAHQKGTAREWTADKAREAGRKGGTAPRRRIERHESGPAPERSNARE